MTRPQQNPKKPTRQKPGNVTPARRAADRLLARVLDHGDMLESVLDHGLKGLEGRERAFAHAIVLTALRHKGLIDRVLRQMMDKPLPPRAKDVRRTLLSGAAQILFMDVPAHAVVSQQLDLLGQKSRFRGLCNAVLRRIDTEGADLLQAIDRTRFATPGWLWRRWVKAYGDHTTRDLATAHLQSPPPLDLTVKSDAASWVDKLGGTVLPNGTVRLNQHDAIDRLPGYADGDWWVQDVAAALPARMLGDVAGKRVLDLCAAPGGKTAQLAISGAEVTALDRSEARLDRLKQNMDRLSLTAECITADATEWMPPAAFDAVLLDAPCSATGTMRRHPDLGWTKTHKDVAGLTDIQAALLDRLPDLIRPGGTAVYCVCSLEPEEGEEQITSFLRRNREFDLSPIRAEELGGFADAITEQGTLRTLPCMLSDQGGMDGFFAARLIRKTG